MSRFGKCNNTNANTNANTNVNANANNEQRRMTAMFLRSHLHTLMLQNRHTHNSKDH